jgi:hypothetical protein
VEAGGLAAPMTEVPFHVLCRCDKVCVAWERMEGCRPPPRGAIKKRSFLAPLAPGGGGGRWAIKAWIPTHNLASASCMLSVKSTQRPRSTVINLHNRSDLNRAHRQEGEPAIDLMPRCVEMSQLLCSLALLWRPD